MKRTKRYVQIVENLWQSITGEFVIYKNQQWFNVPSIKDAEKILGYKIV